MFPFFMALWGPNSFATEKDDFSGLASLTIECRNTVQVGTCRQALFLTEVLQRQAASKGNYACQSRLLGLGADLLMISFDAVPKTSVLAILREVKTFCRGI